MGVECSSLTRCLKHMLLKVYLMFASDAISS
jgi:hypothetical protein